MLIYNHKKEFTGIDEDDLKNLGLNSLSQLLSECSNFADLFVKKPGYIHNFKNFEWIDFVLHAEAEESKAIIHVNEHSYSCNIVINNLYLTESPSEVAYSINLQHLKMLNASEGADIAKDIAAMPKASLAKVEIEETPNEVLETPTEALFKNEQTTTLPDFATEETTTLETPDPYDVPEDVTFDPYAKASLDVDEDIFVTDNDPVTFKPESDEEEDVVTAENEEPEVQPELAIKEETSSAEKPMLGDYINSEEQNYIDNLTTPDDYNYDPSIAADELGLPVDLIEEFIGDFIQQSYEFKDDLFDAASKSDFDEVKILSHKLKGVAANLRIEDAFEALSIINTSDSEAEIEAHLKQFYKMVLKLEGKEETVEEPVAPVIEPTENEVDEDEELMLNDDINAFDTIAQNDNTIKENSESTSNDDIYDFDLNTSSSDDEVELPPMPSLDDDIYSFDLAQEEEESASEETSENNDNDNMYEFDLKQPEDGPLYVMEDQLEDVAPSDEENDTFSSSDVIAPPTVLSYDTALASAEIGLPESLITELISDFKNDVQTHQNDLDTAIRDNDSRAWQSIALKLKGIADNLRILDITPVLLALLKADNTNEAQINTDELYRLINQL